MSTMRTNGRTTGSQRGSRRPSKVVVPALDPAWEKALPPITGSGPFDHIEWPHKLKLMAMFHAVLAFILFGAVEYAAYQESRVIRTIGRDAAASTIAAQRIKGQMAGMHAGATDEFLASPGTPERQQAHKTYEEKRQASTENLLRAAEDVGDNGAERTPINDMIAGLAGYTDAIIEARLLQERSDPRFIEVFREADKIMHWTIMPAADRLNAGGSAALSNTYAEHAKMAGVRLLYVLGAAALLLVCLVATQMNLAQTFRRLLNPWLVAATAVAVVFSIYACVTLYGAFSSLEDAKKDAYDSIIALQQARALAFDASGSESVWLLDRERAPEEAKDFAALARMILEVPPQPGLDLSSEKLMEMIAVNKSLPIGANAAGLLAVELKSDATAERMAPAGLAAQAFIIYLRADAKLRAAEDGGRHAEALAIRFGDKDGDLAGEFTRFDKALLEALKLREREFDAGIKRAESRVLFLPFVAPFAALLVALLATFGIWRRVKEYQV